MVRRRRGPFRPTKKNDTLWTALLISGDNMATTVESSNIVVGTAWERGSAQGSLQKATLIAIVGWIQVTALLSTVSSWNYCIAKYDEDEASTDPNLVANYTT